jgi:hypothetical protein
MARKRGDREHDDPLDPGDDEQEEVEASADDSADDDGSVDDDDSVDEDDSVDDDDSADESADGEEDISDTPAPSVGPHTKFEKDDPEERLARHDQSSVDAMGLDKRREVIGGSYSPSLGRQLTMYGIFIAVVAGIVVGFLVLANNLDQPPEKYEDLAPWSQADAREIPPAPIDFPEYGHPGPGEEPQATPGEQEGSATSENAPDTEQ